MVFKVQDVLPSNLQLIHALHFKITHEPILLIISDTTTPIPSNAVKLLRLNPKSSKIEIKRDIMQALTDFSTNFAHSWVVGIDPGFSIGLALLYRDQLFNSTVVYTIDGVIKWIRQHLQTVVSKNTFLIRIGDGGTKVRDDIINRLKKEFNDILMELVNESNTSIRSSSHLTIHENSAILIARRKGTDIRNN